MSPLHQSVGPYQIESELGRGGMGVVYRARDSRLDRTVAIKALPDEVAKDSVRLERFEREARTLASLNHPNIGAIYGVEEQGGQRFLILEYVEGQTLAERLDRGPLPVAEAVEVAVEIARGLEAAHEAGVVHRDLKPANIKITPAGRVKVLDFGLAKTDGGVSSTGSWLSQSPTMTSPMPQHSPTIPGAILGTAAYMSPEQARGRPVDKRTDIWSFGVVLYEMLTGISPFHGETATDSIGAVLHKEPHEETLPAHITPALRRVLGRLLAKDPQKRLHDIADARIELEAVLTGHGDAGEILGTPRGNWYRRIWGYAIGFVVGAAMAGTVGWSVFDTRTASPQVVKFEIPVRDFSVGTECAPRISPDGRWIVLVGDRGLWLRGMDQTAPRLLAGTENATHPFWAPDSKRIGYMVGKRLYRIALDGGVSVICETPKNATDVAGAGWRADDQIVFTTGNDALYQVSASGGQARVLFSIDPQLEEDFHQASALPGNRGELLVVHRLSAGGDTIAVYANGARKTLIQEPGDLLYNPVYASSGHILFYRKLVTPGVWAAPFSLDRLEVTGEPFLVAASGSEPSVSEGGTLVYASGSNLVANQLVWLDRTGEPRSKIGESLDFIQNPHISPDGNTVAVGAADKDNRDVWLHDIQRGTRTRLTFEPTDEVYAIWSPDGERLAVSTGWTVGREWSLQRIDARGEKRPMGPGRPRCFSSDGEFVVGDVAGESGNDICYWDNEGEISYFLRTPFNEDSARLSPDDAFLVYRSDESGRDEIYMTRFPSGEGKWLISTNGGIEPLWSADGTEILYLEGGALMTVPVTTADGVTVGKPERLFVANEAGVDLARGFDLSADGQSILAVQVDRGSGSPNDALIVVQNWYAEHGGQ